MHYFDAKCSTTLSLSLSLSQTHTHTHTHTHVRPMATKYSLEKTENVNGCHGGNMQCSTETTTIGLKYAIISQSFTEVKGESHLTEGAKFKHSYHKMLPFNLSCADPTGPLIFIFFSCSGRFHKSTSATYLGPSCDLLLQF